MEGVSGGVIFSSLVVEGEEAQREEAHSLVRELSDWSTAAAVEEMQMARGFSPRFI